MFQKRWCGLRTASGLENAPTFNFHPQMHCKPPQPSNRPEPSNKKKPEKDSSFLVLAQPQPHSPSPSPPPLLSHEVHHPLQTHAQTTPPSHAYPPRKTSIALPAPPASQNVNRMYTAPVPTSSTYSLLWIPSPPLPLSFSAK